MKISGHFEGNYIQEGNTRVYYKLFQLRCFKCTGNTFQNLIFLLATLRSLTTALVHPRTAFRRVSSTNNLTLSDQNSFPLKKSFTNLMLVALQSENPEEIENQRNSEPSLRVEESQTDAQVSLSTSESDEERPGTSQTHNVMSFAYIL